MMIQMDHNLRESILAAVLFYILSMPSTYSMVNGLIGNFITTSFAGVPTESGLVVHAVVAGVLFYVANRVLGM